MSNSAILLIHCPDQPGLVALVTEFVHKNRGNILNLDQHVDRDLNHFFMRIEWDLAGFIIPREKINDYFATLIGNAHGMKWQLKFTEHKPRMVLFVSKASHCLYDILQRYGTEEFNCDIPAIVSNHEHLRYIAERFDIPFHYLPITAVNKAEQEARTIALLEELEADFIVLARYMQILSDDFCQHFQHRIINIHHSFLPAFKGARPYHSAFERGVKLIGATSHYVTADLDEGPIIAQDVERVSHRDGTEDLQRIGKDVEKRVLSRAIYLQLQHLILPFGNRTIIFH
ncbi:formyltetrahydrofolate deformylase [Neolewinella lacunae]|uniref:Formyltetrahydrofolate deformylase n=1 Tax=Neolewinella lacunae TaxID=1517758 RepID=A0A923PHP2_9BACT|nr:formyltetrahydrofolate deformylase [Neolewinella lacunae]MBC6992901.1 formyltetrahydrofolate deformylase [Neolewinella lacunae]MDN3633735.1 formyltetrahydrofolate deformylase [Neolewinella lacunae]